MNQILAEIINFGRFPGSLSLKGGKMKNDKFKIILAKTTPQFYLYCQRNKIDYHGKRTIRPLEINCLRGIDLDEAEIIFLRNYDDNPGNRRVARMIRDRLTTNKPIYADL